ncbi:hypothetical protein AB0N23_23885, partial [Streptomyces sp. NPDC052644]
MTTMTWAWEDLVTSALLGTDRRPLPARTPEGGGAADAPAALLDAAAVETGRRRGGLGPAAAAPLPPPAPDQGRAPR